VEKHFALRFTKMWKKGAYIYICHPMVTALVKRYKTLINENYNTSSEEVAPENKGKKSCI
jgi:hypothetical protein